MPLRIALPLSLNIGLPPAEDVPYAVHWEDGPAEALSGGANSPGENLRNSARTGIAMLSTADSSLIAMERVLKMMRQLAQQGTNAALTTTDRAALQREYAYLREQINVIAGAAVFGNSELLSANATSVILAFPRTVDGSQDTQPARLTVTFASTDTYQLAVSAGVSVGGANSAAIYAIASIDASLSTVAERRTSFGAIRNRLQLALQGKK